MSDDDSKKKPKEKNEEDDWELFQLPSGATSVSFPDVVLPNGQVVEGRQYDADDGRVRLHPVHHQGAMAAGARLIQD